MPTVVNIDASQYANQALTSEDFDTAGIVGTRPSDAASHKFTDTEMRQLHNMFSQWTSNGLNVGYALDNFNRFYSVFPEMEMPSDLKTYVFITRPEMNLLGSSTSYSLSGNPSSKLSKENYTDSRLQYLYSSNPEILYMLSENFSGEHDFIPYLQGRTESLQLPDYQIRTSDFTIPFYSYKFTYPTVTNESITGGTFDISFREDSELRITKLFQFWIYYMDAVMKNKMSPDRSHIINNFYDFMCSVYEFVCDPTTERILYWAKYTGCYPTSVPISNLSHNLRSTVDNKVSIQFNYMMVECLEPRVIEDFDQNTSGVASSRAYVPVYDETYGMVGESTVGCPKIVLSSDESSLLLKWTSKVKGKSANLNSLPSIRNISQAMTNANVYRSQILAHRDEWGVSTSDYSSQITSALGSHLSNNTDS